MLNKFKILSGIVIATFIFGCAHIQSYTTLQKDKAANALKFAKSQGATVYNKAEYDEAFKLYKQGIEKQKKSMTGEANTLFSLSTQLANEVAVIAKENSIRTEKERKITLSHVQQFAKKKQTVTLKVKLAPFPKPVSIAKYNTPAGKITKTVKQKTVIKTVLLSKNKTYTVVKDDCLWDIAKKGYIYGNPVLWPLIYWKNRNRIKNPNYIYPEQKIIIPKKSYSKGEIRRIMEYIRKKHFL